ncbi:hypothetical protein HRbin06_00132 [archaeon HR06]|nr:hypothetical protein HRbin06_00132 [archaeon HR06]
MRYSELYNRVGEEVLKKIVSIVQKNYSEDIEALCLYGSRVAGYAKEDSDYDIIIAVKDYNKKIRYNYINDEINVSSLAVDTQLLIKDAEKAYLGEFVIGRLLNPYLPLIGEDFLIELEKIYKKRVIIESIYEIFANYSKFISLLKIPLNFFLYDKLKKRASFYPPAIYSYSKTYSPELRDVNLRYALEGFKRAALELEREGYINLIDDFFVKIDDNGLTRLEGIKLLSFVNLERKIKHYAIHGFAGRVSLKVIGKEVASKLSRFREVSELPKEIKTPKRLWVLEEGKIIEDGENWIEVIAEEYGLKHPFTITSYKLGEIYNVSKFYTLDDGEKKISFVVKNFLDFKNVKWTILSLWTFASKKFSLTAFNRLYNEYIAHLNLRRLGIKTPKILFILLDEKILIKEYIEGVNMSKIIQNFLEGDLNKEHLISLLGKKMAMIHNFNYSLGDTKASNFIVHNDDIYLTDLEQAQRGGNKAWDIALFLYFSCKLNSNTQICERFTRAFLEGYLKLGSIDVVKEAAALKYLTPFQVLIFPNVAEAIRRTIREVVKA